MKELNLIKSLTTKLKNPALSKNKSEMKPVNNFHDSFSEHEKNSSDQKISGVYGNYLGVSPSGTPKVSRRFSQKDDQLSFPMNNLSKKDYDSPEQFSWYSVPRRTSHASPIKKSKTLTNQEVDELVSDRSNESKKSKK